MSSLLKGGTQRFSYFWVILRHVLEDGGGGGWRGGGGVA